MKGVHSFFYSIKRKKAQPLNPTKQLRFFFKELLLTPTPLLLVPTNMRKDFLILFSFPSPSFHPTKPVTIAPRPQATTSLHDIGLTVPPPPQTDPSPCHSLTVRPLHRPNLILEPPHLPNLNATSPSMSCVISNFMSASVRHLTGPASITLPHHRVQTPPRSR